MGRKRFEWRSGVEGGAGLPIPAPVVWQPSFRIIAASRPPLRHFEIAESPADAERNLALARLTDPAASGLRDAYRLLPNEDRLSGRGTGLLMPSFLFPARPGRFSSGRAGGTYYAAREEATAVAETANHYAAEVESAPAALEAARAAGTFPQRAMQVIAADVFGLFLDVRRRRDPLGVGDVYHPTDYGPGQRLERVVRAEDLDGVWYHSVRRRKPPSECLAVYRPRALRNGRQVRTLIYRWLWARHVQVS